MPKIESWDNFPAGVRQHLIDRMRDRAISISDLNQLRLWDRLKARSTGGRLVQRLRLVQDLWARIVPENVSPSRPGFAKGEAV